ncbi:MAG: MFS transporter [Betaproteobacteria bacterium]|nr:MFS transporter [Betaproteobacteria bacterium]
MPLPCALRAFRHRDYRLYFAGQGISQTGTWLQLIATSWLVYGLSGSAFLLGLAAFALQIPMLVLGPLAGVWVDRINKRKALLIMQNGALAQSLAMLALVASGEVQVWHLILANLVLGVLNAIESPARQSQLVELVGGREDLPNAIAFSSALMNSARFIGPMIGGAVIGALGVAWGFALNCLMRCAVIVALALIRATPRVTERGRDGWLRQLAAGFRYAFGFLPTRSALLLLAAVSFSVQPYQSLAPYFARDVFHGGSATLGWLIGAGGFGAAAGTVYLAMRPTIRGLLTLMPVAGATAGAALIGFSFSTTLWLAIPLLVVVGVGAMLTAAATNTVLQTIVEDHMRARVVSIYMMAFLGMAPLGALFAGTLSEAIGPPAVLGLGGTAALVAAAAYWTRLGAIRSAIRPIYEKLGIAPRPAAED